MTVDETRRVAHEIHQLLSRVQEMNGETKHWSKLENLLLYAAQEATENVRRAVMHEDIGLRR